MRERERFWHFLLFIIFVAVSSCGGGSSNPPNTPQGTAPSAPTGLNISAGDRQITVTWQSVPGAQSYNIYWSTASGVTKGTGTRIANATNPFSQTGLTNGTTYYYVLTSVNSFGESAESNEIWATPPGPVPSAPTGLNISAGDRQVTVTWQSVPEAKSYNIYWSTSSGVTKGTGTKIASATNPFLQTGLANGTTYYYVITSVNDFGESAESNEISTTPPIRIMPLGDSITVGSPSCANPDDDDHSVSYRKALWDKLTAAGYEFDFVGSEAFGGAILSDPDNEGHSGWCADGCSPPNGEILQEVYGFLVNNPADVVLLHIGTNDLNSGVAAASEVSGILDEIYRYGRDQNRDIWVILALIIRQANPPCSLCSETTSYNNAVRLMAESRIQNGDKIVIVDMENGAGIDYRLQPAGDMCDNLHPYATGYEKMATVWFNGFQQIF